MQYHAHKQTPLFLLCILLCAVVALLPSRAAADQRAAMHPAEQSLLAAAPRAPHYALTGSVDIATRTLRAQQVLTWHNDTDRVVTALPFWLFANLDDFAGQSVITHTAADGSPILPLYSQRNTLITLQLPRPIAPGGEVTVTIGFTTTLPAGRGQDKYGAFNDDGTTLAFASAYPILADYRDGQWQTGVPDTKGDLVNSPMATYTAAIQLPTTHTLVSTGSTLGIEPQGDQQIHHISSGLQRDFAFAVTTLPRHSTMVDGTRVSVYAANGDDVGINNALTAAAQSLRLFNTRYGRYPYTELDFVAVDAGSFYGVEYPGFILLRDSLLSGDATLLERIVVHEVAHQWFYNLVGNDVQRDAWVDESIATYAQVIYRRAFQGPDAAAAELTDLQRQYQRLIDRELDAPVAQHMRAYTLYSFNVLAYAKGALFYEAVAQQLTPAVFDRVLRAYVTTYRGRSADGDAFLTTAERICGCSMTPLYETWILSPIDGSTP